MPYFNLNVLYFYFGHIIHSPRIFNYLFYFFGVESVNASDVSNVKCIKTSFNQNIDPQNVNDASSDGDLNGERKEKKRTL